MKTNKIKYLILLLATLSCSDLEEEVFSQLSPGNFYKNAADGNAAVIAIYNAMNRPVNMWDFGMLSATFMPAPHTQSRVPWRESWANYTVTAGDGVSLPRVWNPSYQAIFRANSALENLSTAAFEENEESTRMNLIAEAQWLRAYNYFNLVRLFGAVPMPLTTATSIEGASLERTPVAQVYEQIITDLQAAEATLPDLRTGSGELGRPTAGAAKFLLGKVYLTMAGQPLNDASKMAMAHAKLKEVIDNRSAYGYELLDDYEAIFRNDLNSEVVFAVQQSQAVDNQGTALSFVWGGPNWPWGNGGQYHGGFTREFYESYEETDVRRDVTCAYTYVGLNGDTMIYGTDGEDTNGDGNFTPYDKNEIDGIAPNKYHDADQVCCNGDPDILIYRFADALLMYAEAENELNGPTSEAFTYLNAVRARAQASEYNPAGVTQEAFRELIYQERFWELSFEFHEVFDIRRLGKVEEAVENNPEAQRIGMSYDPKMELWPIPLNEIQANGKIEQNPGW